MTSTCVEHNPSVNMYKKCRIQIIILLPTLLHKDFDLGISIVKYLSTATPDTRVFIKRFSLTSTKFPVATFQANFI